MPGCRGAAFFRRGKTQGTPHGVPFFVGHTATVLGNNLPGTGLYQAAVAAYPGMHRTTVRPPAVICRSGRALPGCADGKRSASLGSLPGHGGSGPSMPGIRHNRGTTGWEEYGQDTESRGVQEGTGKDGGVGTGRHRPRTGGHPGPPGIWRDSRAGCLDARQRRLITLVVLAAIQTPEGIGEETRAALHQGVRPEEIREALYQCAPYIGFPRTEAALRHADAALEAAGMALPLPEGGTVSEEDRFEKGLAVQTGIFGDAISKMHASAPEGQREILVRHLSAFCFGDIYTRTGLDLPLRELLTFCIISALGGCEAQVRAHVQGNAAVGNGKQLLVDALLQMLPCIGFPRTLNALACVNSVLPEA